MLITKKELEPNTTVSIKMLSGEEIIAKFISEDEKSIKVTKAMVLTMSQGGIGMTPYFITVDPEKQISLLKTSVTSYEETEKSAASQYVKATTGLIT